MHETKAYGASMKGAQLRRWRFMVLVVSLVSAAISGLAAPGDECWDSRVGLPGVDGYSVGAVALHSGLVFAGGTFLTAGGVAATNIAVWDGERWAPVGGGIGTGLAHGVIALASSGADLYAGGVFPEAGGVAAADVARWDGVRWWPLGSGIQRGVVKALATDGQKVYVGGNFTNAGGIAATNTACWDGQQWSSLSPGLRLTGNEIGAVYALAVRGEELYAGGDFTHAGDLWVNGIARWDGTNWWPLGDGVFGVISMAFAGSNLYVGGHFRRAGTVVTTNIAMWNGHTWEAVGGGVTHDDTIPFDGGVVALAAAGDRLYAGGNFFRIGGVSARMVALWDGRTWSPLGSGVYLGGVLDLACSGSELYLGGGFSTVGGQPSTNIALWHIPPSLGIRQEGEAAVVSWPATGTNFVLESQGQVSTANWSEVAQPFILTNSECVVTDPLTPSNKLYRLRRR